MLATTSCITIENGALELLLGLRIADTTAVVAPSPCVLLLGVLPQPPHPVLGERYALDLIAMTTRDHTMNMALTSAMLGELVVRSITLGAAVSLGILLLAALFSSSI